MRTDPLSDAWDFLVASQPDQRALGDLQWPLAGLFALLLLGSGLIALAVWRQRQNQYPGGVGAGPFFAWLFRLLVGIMWFQGALWKLPFPVAPGFQYWTEQIAQNAAWPWFGAIVTDYMLPHMAIVDPFVFVIEMGLALSLMLGLFVRPVATLGAIYVLGLWIGLYRHPDEWPWQYVFLSALHGMFAIVGGSFSFGLDALLIPLWRQRR